METNLNIFLCFGVLFFPFLRLLFLGIYPLLGYKLIINKFYLLTMELSNLIQNDSDSFLMLSKEQRTIEAKRIYQLLRNSPNKPLLKEQDKSAAPTLIGDQISKQQMQGEGKEHLCNKVCLIVLEGLQNGAKLRVIRKEHPHLEGLSKMQLSNTPILALKKLSKMFIELLPKNIINFSQKQFYNKYLFNGRMLVFFKRHNLSLIRAFRNLFQIKDWQKENKEYMIRGYSRDYLPEEIKGKLTELAETYKQMNLIYDTFESQIIRQKRNRTPKTEPSLPIVYPITNQSIKNKISVEELQMDEIKKEEDEK